MRKGGPYVLAAAAAFLRRMMVAAAGAVSILMLAALSAGKHGSPLLALLRHPDRG
jgi:hypothetical protein